GMQHTLSRPWSKLIFFFFSSRRRHTRLVSDWSSDVCSSDLQKDNQHCKRFIKLRGMQINVSWHARNLMAQFSELHTPRQACWLRSEERRVGKEGRSGWGAEHSKKKEKTTGVARDELERADRR